MPSLTPQVPCFLAVVCAPRIWLFEIVCRPLWICGDAHRRAGHLSYAAGQGGACSCCSACSVSLQACLTLAVPGQVEVCGRSINVGRPKGYVEPPAGAMPSNIGAAQMFAATLARAPTRVLLLANMLKAPQMLDDTERIDVRSSLLVFCVPAGLLVSAVN